VGQAETIDLERMRSGYAAIARQDWDEVQALYDPEIEWVDPPEVPDGGVHVGLEAVRRSWQNYLDALEDWALEPVEFVTGEDEIVVRSHVTGVARHTGIPIDMELFQVWTARDGLLIRQRAFFDRGAAYEAAGIPNDGP
jgi:ketosteroid isomerase-like protein